MIQLVIKIVERLASLKSGVHGVSALICFVKSGGESAEHRGEGKVCFAVSVVACGIEQEGFSLRVVGCVSAP